jgi:hypothetical protein
MNHDAADLAMFWVGALFVFTPITFFGVILGVWWYQQKKRSAQDSSPQSAQRAQRGP